MRVRTEQRRREGGERGETQLIAFSRQNGTTKSSEHALLACMAHDV